MNNVKLTQFIAEILRLENFTPKECELENIKKDLVATIDAKRFINYSIFRNIVAEHVVSITKTCLDDLDRHDLSQDIIRTDIL
ncbi:hypothetical protein [Photobacterium damselae]|uniref:hypothetical protein n=1 Tax=Photobacterium damselae TaxID=38293 RepID=UPI00406812C8